MGKSAECDSLAGRLAIRGSHVARRTSEFTAGEYLRALPERERERAPDSVAATRRKLGKISLGEAAKNFSTADDDCDDSARYAATAKHPKRDIERIAGPE